MGLVAALLKRDLMLAWRQGGGAGTAFGFFLTVLVLTPIAIGPDQALLRNIAPGILWLALLLSVLLSADQIFQSDFEDGSLDVMVLAPAPLELIVVIKALVHWLTASLPLAILAPLLGFLLNLDTQLIPVMTLAMFIGSLALSLLASLGAALTVGLRRAGLLASLLILPLYSPILIFGISATSGIGSAVDTSQASLLVLAAIAFTALVTVPFATAAALRIYLR